MPARFSIVAALAGPSGANFFRGFSKETLASGQLFCTGQGDRNVVFMVMRGRLRVYLLEAEKELTLFYLSAWDLFSTHSGCMVEAVEPTELRVATIQLFEEKMQACPAVAFSVVSVLGRAMTACLRTIRDLMFHEAAERMVNFFVDCAVTEGRQTARGIEIKIDMTVEEIGQLVGLSRQRTSATLNELLKRGVLWRVARGHYVIPDLDALHAARFSAPKPEQAALGGAPVCKRPTPEQRREDDEDAASHDERQPHGPAEGQCESGSP